MPKLPTYFICHGGGPWPWLPNMRQMLASLETSLVRMPAEIGTTPKAILMISGHWEENDFAVMSSAQARHDLRLRWLPTRDLQNHLPRPRRARPRPSAPSI